MRNPRKSYQASYRISESSIANAERLRAPRLGTLFPALLQLRVELAFHFNEKLPPARQIHILHPPAAAYFRYPCPIYGCNGEFRLDSVMMRFLRERRSGMVEQVGCSGVRAQDRITGKSCGTRLEFTLDASYGAAIPPFLVGRLHPGAG
jgi:hypothetical protein